MSDRFFLDTNVFVYAFDVDAPSKARKSDALIRSGIHTGEGIVSYQVVQEFFNVAFKKFPKSMNAREAHTYYASVFRPMLSVMFSPALLLRGLGIREQHRIPWYDALIVAAAVESECTMLYTEDFQDGRKIEGVEIRNPFTLLN
jgi:predicted nucleic acid-binding protein